MFFQSIRYFTFSLTAVLLALDVCAQENAKLGIPDAATLNGDAGSAEIVIRSSGMPMQVDYSISYGEEACKGFERIGAVFENTGKEKLLPWIAKLNEKSRKIGGATTELKKTVASNKPIQIKGYSHWTEHVTFIMTNRSCGPLVTMFTPSNSSIYLVEFLWSGNNCTQHVSDITDPAERKAVPVQTVSQCGRD